jgi:hypothetical protein
MRQFEVDNRCGISGDPGKQAIPREAECGGRYWSNANVRTYSAGEVHKSKKETEYATQLSVFQVDSTLHFFSQTIPIHLQSNTQNRGGGFEMHLCSSTVETEECFKKLVLGNGETF